MSFRRFKGLLPQVKKTVTNKIITKHNSQVTFMFRSTNTERLLFLFIELNIKTFSVFTTSLAKHDRGNQCYSASATVAMEFILYHNTVKTRMQCDFQQYWRMLHETHIVFVSEFQMALNDLHLYLKSLKNDHVQSVYVQRFYKNMVFFYYFILHVNI